ncbi:putative secreted protein (Por secretion system target) [Winogradskyella pacifica]|uniref:Putative secreted protein (Por secretion system target) n=1 Tax=Winogradskyella pacifica TaxID=664642 RepID=A0A3D9N1T4_9FLAO|nr:T9SS type A sorting domain-containing protein [Winogradskyella pacifica]REE25687.1 putative secreted protein (Por secretion system target) [Winogradskyella pacifica]
MNTKAKIYTALSLLVSTYSFSQAGPGGVTTDNEIWLKAENSSYIDAGTTLGANDSAIQQWNDASGNTNNALQTDSGLRPKLKTNAINGYSALNFDGTDDGIFATGVGHSDEVSLFVVLQSPSLDDKTRGIIQAGPSGTAFSTDANDKTIGMWATNGYLWGRGVQSDGAKKSFINGNGIKLNIDTPYVLTQDFKGTSITQYINAEASQTISYDGTLNSFSDFGIGRQSTTSFKGDIAEVILYKRSLNLAETTIVENYLSAKYGTALDASKDFYIQDNTGNGNFDHSVAGIGQASDGSNHSASRGTGIVSMSGASNLNDSEYLFWGEETKDPVYDFETNTANNSQELTSKWRVSKVGDLGTVTVEFDTTTISAATEGCQGLQLVVGNDNTFTTSTAYNLTVSGDTATATGVSFADGDYFTLSFISDIVWDGTDYFKGSVVSGAPATDTCYRLIIKSGTNAVLTADAEVKSVLVEAGASLTIDSGVTLTVTEAVNLTSESNSYSSLITDGTISGTVNYDRFVNSIGSGATGTGGNDLISLPLMPTGLTFDTFIAYGDNATEIASNVTQYAFAPYDNVTDSAYENFLIGGTEDVLLKGKGYRVATNSGDLITFSGAPDNGTVNFTIVNSALGNQWNLIGNPYPSYIDADLFLNTANSALLDASAVAIYAYNSGTYTGDAPTTSNFTIINKATITEFTGENFNIAPGQGFFVASNAIGGAIEFTPAMRTLSGDDDYIAGRTSNENEFFKLNLTGSQTYSTSIFFNTNASLGLDPGYDAAVYGDDSENYPIYSHLVEENTGRAMALQAIDNTDLTSVSIPLGVNANQGEAITFSVNTSNLSSTTLVYLEDTVANTSTLLNSGDYTLTPSTNLSGTGRFYLHISNSTLSTVDNTLNQLNIYTNEADKTIVVAGQLAGATKATIYDLQGRVILSENLMTSSTSQAIDVSGLSTGVYIVELNNITQNKTQKVILK